MDSISNAPAARTDVVLVESSQRPTPRPARVAFGDVLAAGASGIAQGAQLAVSALPGSALTAAAVRGGTSAAPLSTSATSGSFTAEGPGASVSSNSLGALGIGTGTTPSAGAGVSIGGVNVGSGSTSDTSGSIEASLAQSANLNIYYLQLQEQEDAQNRAFTAQSNILKTEHDGAKNAIGNIHS